MNHAFAKEVLAGFVGGEVDKLAETKGGQCHRLNLRVQDADLILGMNEYERERAHHQAKENASHMYEEHYVRGQNADEYNPNQYGPPEQFRRGRDDY